MSQHSSQPKFPFPDEVPGPGRLTAARNLRQGQGGAGGMYSAVLALQSNTVAAEKDRRTQTAWPAAYPLAQAHWKL